MTDYRRLREVFESLKENVGKTIEHDHGVIDRRLIGRYAVAIGETNPIHRDPEAATAAGYKDVVAPLNMAAAVVDWGHGVAAEDLNIDGTGGGDGWLSKETSGIRIMGGGEVMRFHHALTAGMHLIEIDTLADVIQKSGKSGEFILIISDLLFRTNDGLDLCSTRRTVIGRA